MTDHVRVLLIDDDQEDFLIVSDMLAEAENTRFKLACANSYEEGLDAIFRREHDVYLLDYFMGSHNGLDLLKEAIEGGCRAPIIFLTAHGSYEVDLKAMEAGASDYLVKGEFTAPILERSIRYSIMSKHVEEELKLHRSNLEELVRKRTIQHAEARADAERRAHEAEGRQAILEALLEHIPVGIILVNAPDLRVQAFSRYAVDMIGLSDERGSREQPLTDLDLSIEDLWPDGAGLLRPIRDAALRGQVTPAQEHLFKVRGGKGGVHVLVSAGPIRDGFGNVTGAVAAWRDISELKRTQEELRVARDNLELRVQQRTLELAETLKELKESRGRAGNCSPLSSCAPRKMSEKELPGKSTTASVHRSVPSSFAWNTLPCNSVTTLRLGKLS